MSMLRVIFMGTPDFSVPTLSEIVAAGHEVMAVYSQPPRRSGRGMSERRSPVHQFAVDSDIPVFTPLSLRKEPVQEQFQKHDADVAVVVAYGLILPKPILDAPREGCLNLHASALPRWRGAAPIQRAIMAGDTHTAAMVMRMDKGLDTGPICLADQIAIGPNMTAGELHDVLSLQGADLVLRALAALSRGSLETTVQSNEGVTYAAKIDKAEARIDFSKDARAVHNLIRGLSPFPGAWFEAHGGTSASSKPIRIKVLRSELTDESTQPAQPGEILDDALSIACGTGAVRLIQVQPAGKRPMSALEFLRGRALKKGGKLRAIG